jgi:hypothetical protein
MITSAAILLALDSPNLALVVSIAMTLLLAVYIFMPPKDVLPFTRKTRLDFLEERRDVVYENLRDLNFDFRAGKYPEQDYSHQRDLLEAEAAAILAEMDTLQRPVR